MIVTNIAYSFESVEALKMKLTGRTGQYDWKGEST